MNAQPDVKQRVRYIDIARGITLFFVVLGHLIPFGSKSFNHIFSFHMPLFFILSGMCTNMKKYDNFSDYLKSKIKSLIIPYFTFVAIGLIMSLIIPAWKSGLNVDQVINHVFYYTQPESLHVGPIWFLIALFFSSLLFYVIEKIAKTSKPFRIVTYLAFSIIGFNITKYIATPGVIATTFYRLPFKLDVALTAVIFIKIGNVIKNNKIVEKICEKNILSVLTLLAIFYTLNYYLGAYTNGYVNICDCIYNNYFNYYIAAVTGSLFILIVSYKIKKNKVLEFYGKNSLSMFAIHSMYLALSAYILTKIYKYPVQIMQNVSIRDSFIVTFAILIGLVPFAIVYNFVKKKISKIIKVS